MRTWLLLILLYPEVSLYAQNLDPLSGRKYAINVYIGKEHDSKQTLAFDDGVMTFTEASKYGFVPDSYKWKQKNDSTWTFLSISKSAKNGTMTWEGKVVSDKVEGTCIWTRKVENAVNYTFKGSRIQE